MTGSIRPHSFQVALCGFSNWKALVNVLEVIHLILLKYISYGH